MNTENDPELPGIERERLARIARNQAMLRTLEVTQAAQELACSIRAERDAASAAETARLATYQPPAGTVVRRSTRTAAMAATHKLQAAAQDSDHQSSSDTSDAGTIGDGDSANSDGEFTATPRKSSAAVTPDVQRMHRHSSSSSTQRRREDEYVPLAAEATSSGSPSSSDQSDAASDSDAAAASTKTEQQQQQQQQQQRRQRGRSRPAKQSAAARRRPKQTEVQQVTVASQQEVQLQKQEQLKQAARAASAMQAATMAATAAGRSLPQAAVAAEGGAHDEDEDWQLQLALQMSMQEDQAQQQVLVTPGNLQQQEGGLQQQKVELSLLNSSHETDAVDDSGLPAAHGGTAERATKTAKRRKASKSAKVAGSSLHGEQQQVTDMVEIKGEPAGQQQQQEQQQQPKNGRKRAAGGKVKKSNSSRPSEQWSADELFDIFAAFEPGDAAVITKRHIAAEMGKAGLAPENGLVERMMKYAKGLVQKERQLMGGGIADTSSGLEYEDFLVLARNLP